MSTVPLLPAAPGVAQRAEEEAAHLDRLTLQLANQDECVVDHLGGVRGVLAGIILGAALWIGLIVAGAALIK